jgi:hypothetical protein
MMLQSTFQKGADYLREVSTLVLVFIPFDVWRHAKIGPRDVLEVALASGLLFLLGMAFDWTGQAVAHGREAWAREIWTEEQAS